MAPTLRPQPTGTADSEPVADLPDVGRGVIPQRGGLAHLALDLVEDVLAVARVPERGLAEALVGEPWRLVAIPKCSAASA